MAPQYGWTFGEGRFDWPAFRNHLHRELDRLEDLFLSLREMDEAGIDVQVLTHGAPSTQVGPVSEVRVTFGREIDDKPRVIGQREKDRLTKELREEVEKLTQPPSAYGTYLGRNDDGTT